MGRDAEAQAKDTYNTQKAQSAKYSANSDNGYSTLMPMYTQLATNPSGMAKSTLNNLTTTGMQSTGGSVAGAVGAGNLAAARTGNVGGYQYALDNAMRTGIKTNADNALTVQNEDAAYKANQVGTGLTGIQNLYNSNLGAATGQTNAQNQSTQALTDAGKSGWFQNMTGLISAVGQAAGAACPAEGSLYLMADGSEKPVESLVVGDLIQGIDEEAQTIDEIQSIVMDILEVATDVGLVARNSLTHAFALPKGGFTVAARCLGKTILTAKGNSPVVRVEPAGKARVFNVMTDGSHTYRADGIWALGVGEAERQVNMDAWDKIAKGLAVNRG